MPVFTYIFLAALGLSLLSKFWLARRHLQHVAHHRDKVPPSFASRIALEAHRHAADYTTAKTRLSFIQNAQEALVVLAFTLGGGLQYLANTSAGLSESPLLQGLILILSVIVISAVLEMPLNLYRTFGIEKRFGFNKMTPAMFIADVLKQSLLGLLFGAPMIAAVLWLMAEMGEYWWFYAWLAWMGFNLLVLSIYPTFIAPLFNKFSPLEDAALKERINSLLKKCGFAAEGLYVMDGSKRSTHGNAYFTGFGKNRRIVLFDTLIARLAPEEIEAVLAHELGHFKRRHILKRISMLFALSLGFLYLLGVLMGAPWFYQGLNVTTQSTGTAMVLFFLALPAFALPFEPLFSLLSRKHEFEADEYAARQTDAATLSNALIKLYRDNAATLTPDPLYSACYDSHPPALQRIEHLQKIQLTP
ncbi:MAG: M48 family metallopeptidase [Burkholderiales bacterium]